MRGNSKGIMIFFLCRLLTQQILFFTWIVELEPIFRCFFLKRQFVGCWEFFEENSAMKFHELIHVFRQSNKKINLSFLIQKKSIQYRKNQSRFSCKSEIISNSTNFLFHFQAQCKTQGYFNNNENHFSFLLN